MQAIEICTPGDPSVLRLVDRPMPACGDGEVLIEVAAAGVNRPDVMQRQGKYPPPPGASDIPGLEVSGVVVDTRGTVDGPHGRAWRPGDRVCALVTGGGYAEYCVAPAGQCLPAPASLDLVDAAGIPETFFTVWTNLFERGGLRAGERLLVHGGASGIGTTAIQLARARGAVVFATAGTAEKCAACERLGAARAFNYREQDFAAALRSEAPDGADVVLDMVGAEYLARNLDVLAPGGRLVQIAVQRGSRAEVDLRQIMVKRLTLTGSTLRPRPVAEKTRIAAALYRDVWPLLESGTVRPIVHARVPLARASDAHALMESGAHTGKILLVVRS